LRKPSSRITIGPVAGLASRSNAGGQTMTIPGASKPNATVLKVDPEHAGLRVTVILVLVAASGLSFLLLRELLTTYLPQLGSPAILACLGALPVALAVSAGVEGLLKRSWASGRRLVLEPERLRLQRSGVDETVLRWDEPLTDTWWHFRVAGYPRGGRERRIPDRWHCIAGQLQQEGNRIVAYAFVSPSRLDSLKGEHPFFTLEPRDVYDNSLRRRLEGPVRPELPAEVIAGESGRFWLAERNRWQQGVELAPDDFKTLLAAVQERRRVRV
jgi:hypothetical protein